MGRCEQDSGMDEGGSALEDLHLNKLLVRYCFCVKTFLENDNPSYS